MTTYATAEQLQARLSPMYTMPEEEEATRLLGRASELIDYATQGRAAELWAEEFGSGDFGAVAKDLLTNATCDQVEFWLEVGEEHAVTGLRGAAQLGRVQIQNIPGDLGRRTLQGLMQAGLYTLATGAI